MNGSDGDAQTKAMLLSLSARVKSLEAAVAQLQEPAIDRAHRGLAELADKIDGENPDRVPGNYVSELEARKRLARVE